MRSLGADGERKGAEARIMENGGGAGWERRHFVGVEYRAAIKNTSSAQAMAVELSSVPQIAKTSKSDESFTPASRGATTFC